MNTRVCPDCLTRFEGDTERCPADGAPLVEVGFPEEDRRLGTVVRDNYLLTEVLGRGGMGVVYRAWQRSTHRPVAIKTLHGDGAARAKTAEARFVREARITAGLRSPHTVTVHDFGQLEDGDFFLVMELLEGRPLDELLRDRGHLALSEVRDIGAQCCRSLSEAHAHGVVHRDLKPSNVMLETTPDGEPMAKVVDFGISKLADEASTQVTREGATLGTAVYVAPEQIQSAETVGPAADQYALGATLFHLAAGRPPFVDGSQLGLLFKHVSTPPPRLTEFIPSTPAAQQLEAILERCLAKNPDDRFASVDALREALLRPPLGALGAPASRATRSFKGAGAVGEGDLAEGAGAAASPPHALSDDPLSTHASAATDLSADGDERVIAPRGAAPGLPEEASPPAGRPRWLVPAVAGGLVGVAALVLAVSLSTAGPEPEAPGPKIVAAAQPTPAATPDAAPAAATATAPDAAPDAATATAPDAATAPDTAPDAAPDAATAPDTTPDAATATATDAAPDAATAPDASPATAGPAPVAHKPTARRPRARVSGVSIAGDAPRAATQAAFSKLRRKITSCHRRAGLGAVQISVMLSGAGAVRTVRSKPHNAAFSTCVRKALSAARFPHFDSSFAVLRFRVSP